MAIFNGVNYKPWSVCVVPPPHPDSRLPNISGREAAGPGLERSPSSEIASALNDLPESFGSHVPT